jgi:Family of unknown function (DUF5991)
MPKATLPLFGESKMKVWSLFVALMMVLATSVYAQTSQVMAGHYEFIEDGGRTVGGSRILIAHDLQIGPDGAATLKVDGFQSSLDIACLTKRVGTQTQVLFDHHNDQSAETARPYARGIVLFTLERKQINGKAVLWTVMGQYRPTIIVPNKSGGVYFKKLKN